MRSLKIDKARNILYFLVSSMEDEFFYVRVSLRGYVCYKLR